MIPVTDVYNDVARDSVYKDQNGYLDYNMFNRMSQRAELRAQDFLTGNVSGQSLPMSFINQKTKDWLSPFLKKKASALNTDGSFEKPEDYYYYDNLYSLTQDQTSCICDEEECDITPEVKKNVVRILDGDEFNYTANTSIRQLKPTATKAIAKEIGNTFELSPKNIPGVVLEYIGLPVFAKIVSMEDPVFYNEVIDPTASTNYQWPLAAKELLIYFLTDEFANHVKDSEGKQMNNASNTAAAGK